MKILSRVVVGLAFAMSTLPAFAADFYWNCTTPIGTRYADATRCDKGDVGVKVMKTDAAPAAPAASSQSPDSVHPTRVCPADPAVCQRPDFGVSAGTPRAQAIARFLQQKECEFLQRFPKRCERPQ
jgi:hypothetical protein